MPSSAPSRRRPVSSRRKWAVNRVGNGPRTLLFRLSIARAGNFRPPGRSDEGRPAHEEAILLMDDQVVRASLRRRLDGLTEDRHQPRSARVNYTGDQDLPDVPDEVFESARQTVRPYTAVVLRAGPAFEMPSADRSPEVMATIMAHGKRNYALHLAGLMPIVCPIADGGEIVGLGVFDASPEDVERIMAADPAVRADILTYEVHPTRSFPGSTLPS